jgi:hypothetical protein
MRVAREAVGGQKSPLLRIWRGSEAARKSQSTRIEANVGVGGDVGNAGADAAAAVGPEKGGDRAVAVAADDWGSVRQVK